MTGEKIDNTTASNFDPAAASLARIKAEAFMAQSDMSKKAAIFQQNEDVVHDTARQALVAWGNHIMSLTGKASAAVSMVQYGNREQKIAGMKDLADFALQAGVFRALSLKAFAFILASSLLVGKGDDEDDDKTKDAKHMAKQQEIHDWLADHTFFKGGRAITSDEFAYAFWSKWGTEIAAIVAPAAGLPIIQDTLRKYVTDNILEMSGYERKNHEFWDEDLHEMIRTVMGVAGVPIVGALQFERIYRTAGYRIKPDRRDVALLIAQLGGLREYRSYIQREIEKRNNAQVLKRKPDEKRRFYENVDLSKGDFGLDGQGENKIKRPSTTTVTASDAELVDLLPSVDVDDYEGQGYTRYSGKINSSSRNDGDSFYVTVGLLKDVAVRLFHGDAWEKTSATGKDYNHTSEQSRRNGASKENTNRVGAESLYDVKDNFEGKKVYVFTKHRKVHGSDRIYSYVAVPHKGRYVWLHQYIVAKGHGDNIGTKANLPDGTSSSKEANHMRKLNQYAISKGYGAYHYNSKK